MSNFTNKKTNLNTKIDLTPEQQLYNNIFGEGFIFGDSSIKTEEPFVTQKNKVTITKIDMKEINKEKERIFICIVEDEFNHTTGTIDSIVDWLDANEYSEDDNTIVIYELVNPNEINFTIDRVSKITIRD